MGAIPPLEIFVYRRLHIIKCSARFPDPALTLSELLGRLGWNFLCMTQETIYINSSRRFLKFRPWAEIWGPLGAPPGAKNDEKFFSDFSFFFSWYGPSNVCTVEKYIFFIYSCIFSWFTMVSNALIKFDFPSWFSTIRFSLLSASRLKLGLGSEKKAVTIDLRFRTVPWLQLAKLDSGAFLKHSLELPAVAKKSDYHPYHLGKKSLALMCLCTYWPRK